MKTRNINLQNTPLLVNNICKEICLKAPSLLELKKKVKEYEILLVRCLTNAYQLSKLSLDKNGTYTILPDGSYQTSIFLNFSGMKKEETTNPEKTLQYIKHLTGMESKRNGENGEYPKYKQKIKNYHKTIFLPIEIKEGEIEANIISSKQREILEKLVADTNLIKVFFVLESKKRNFDTKNTIMSFQVEYDYRDILELPVEHSNPDEQGNR